MYLSRLCAFPAVLLFTAVLPAQIRPAPANPGNNPNIPNNPNTTTGTLGHRTTMPSMTGVIMLTGKVQLDDGSAPPEPVRLERVCLGRPHAEGFTDPKGHFVLNLGQDLDAMPDASEAPSGNQMPGGNPMGGVRESQLQNCELRAVFAGFRSDSIPLANRRYLDNPDVGTIVLHRTANVQGLTISATSALAPKDARKAYEKGLEAERRNKPDEAQKELQKAVDAYPKYAAAWFALGRVYESRDHFDQAREAYNRSVAADANYVNPYERLYQLDMRDGKWQDVAEVSAKVLRLNPFDFPQAYYINAFANLKLKNWDAAEKSAREAVKLDTAHQNPRAWYVLGISLANKQAFSEAADFLRQYLQMAPDEKDNAVVRKQLAEIEESARAKPQ